MTALPPAISSKTRIPGGYESPTCQQSIKSKQDRAPIIGVVLSCFVCQAFFSASVSAMDS